MNNNFAADATIAGTAKLLRWHFKNLIFLSRKMAF
jgi:hypothetical protein